MTLGDEIFTEIQKRARRNAAATGKPTPTAEYVTRHGLESFLARLAKTAHANDFILKGGILVGVYGVRRPTKDIDAEAVSASVTPEHIANVIADVADVDDDDGIVFDLESINVEVIRDGADYPGLRMRVRAALSSQTLTIAWDISTGDPIVPQPQKVTVPRLLGEPIEMLGYAPETIVAEKGVTILERGITSTRWRDYVDIVQLGAASGFDGELLLESARAVARYRQIDLVPTAPVVAGYGGIAQPKWAAWRRTEKVEEISEALLDEQMSRVEAVLDPLFARGMSDP